MFEKVCVTANFSMDLNTSTFEGMQGLLGLVMAEPRRFSMGEPISADP